ncbi:MAG: putative ATP-binding protein involved in virulence [Verrucomicrobiales bacterium]|jgi:predicted ATP-binding protein involved in virulence
MIRSIQCEEEFPPFKGEFAMDFHELPPTVPNLAEVHLLTGPNGTGKTRILSAIAAVLGNSKPLQKRSGTESLPSFLSFVEDEKQTYEFSSDPDVVRAEFHEFLESGVGTSGIGDILRVAFAYSGNPFLSDSPIQETDQRIRPTKKECLSFSRLEGDSTSLRIALRDIRTQAALDESSQEQNSRAVQMVRALENSIREITGADFAFKINTYPNPSLKVRWNGADLGFDLLPDGLRSLIGWIAHSVVMMDLWLEGKEDPTQAKAVFLLDEIECFLHPAWQRRVLPTFQRLFPNSQIIMATHSPFVISSLNHGWIHPLQLNKDGTVTPENPVEASEGDSYIDVLEDIMGIPEWYDPETEQLLTEFREKRDHAYLGNGDSENSARELAIQIAKRSDGLQQMMGRELAQMDRQLAKAS